MEVSNNFTDAKSTIIRCLDDINEGGVEGLQAAGFKDVYAHIQKGTGHGIAPDGLGVSLAFLRDQLGF